MKYTHVYFSPLQEIKESFNYGLFLPPINGKAGKFLDENRPLGDYPFHASVGYVEVSIQGIWVPWVRKSCPKKQYGVRYTLIFFNALLLHLSKVYCDILQDSRTDYIISMRRVSKVSSCDLLKQVERRLCSCILDKYLPPISF